MSELSRAEFTHYARLTRLVQGRRQADVATAIGVSATALCRYEQGEDQVLGDPTIARLCDALDLERPSWLEVSAAEEVEAAAPTAGESGEDALIPYFCSTPGCLLHRAYMIGGAFGFLPFWVWGASGRRFAAAIAVFCCAPPVVPAGLPSSGIRGYAVLVRPRMCRACRETRKRCGRSPGMPRFGGSCLRPRCLRRGGRRWIVRGLNGLCRG